MESPDLEHAQIRVLSPAVLERVEAAAVAVVALYLYARYGEGWLLFVVLVLVPDLSIPIYFMNSRIGAAVYNLAHTYLWPTVLIGVGVATDSDLVTSIGLIWLAHIGVDRSLGFGLKYPTGFKVTHIQRL